MKSILKAYMRHISDFKFLVILAVAVLISSCSKEVLEEKPQDFLNSDVVLSSREGFESAIVGLHEAARHLYFREDGAKMQAMFLGTDVATTGDRSLPDFNNYSTWLTPTLFAVEHYWDTLYRILIPRANTIIHYADDPDMEWESEAEKNAVVAEARFFRAYAYNFLANLYGGVPIVRELYDVPKTDFERASREEVYQFVKEDLEFASEWLPTSVDVDGRISKAAANHLLAEVYISLEQYEEAVESASRVIEAGAYELMTERFGTEADEPGDVFSDLFAPGNQNRSSGNLESIWTLQFEPRSTPGGTVQSSRWLGNTWLRAWGPKWWEIQDPNGESGMQLTIDSLGRGVAWVRPSNYFNYEIWEGDSDDIRNSEYNIRREFYYNNPESEYFGQQVQFNPTRIDSMVQYYPMIRKVEGDAELTEGASYGRSFNDVYVMRLAETYMLRAEAYYLMGNLEEAAEDINAIRLRAGAEPITAEEVTLDLILDERARELIIEENRRLTLSRMGKLVERTRMYNFQSGPSIEDHHNLFPIPQTAIDANTGSKLEQNPGY